MSSHFSHVFLKSNSSFALSCGNALQSSVVHLRDKMYLLDAGLAKPIVCTQDELTRVPANRTARFTNKVGFIDVSGGKSGSAASLNKAGFADGKRVIQSAGSKILERIFVDMVAGDSLFRDRAAMRLNETVGTVDEMAPGSQIIMPKKFRHHRARMELNKIWQRNRRVGGVVLGTVKGGYAVGIAGFVAFLPLSYSRNKRIVDKFFINLINSNNMNFVVR